MDITVPYYEDNSRISNSNITWFLKRGPRYLNDMLQGKGEGLSLPQLEKGSMIHEYILQPEEFWNDYEILEYEIPKVKQQKDFCEIYATRRLVDSLEAEDDALLNSYNQVYSNKLSDGKKLEAAKDIVKKYEKYIQSREETGKKRITFADLTMLKQIKSNLEEHKVANKLLFDYPTTWECHNEFHINWEYPNASEFGDLPCKSLLDRVVFDHKNKKIILIDLKTTGDLYDFEHSIESFDYRRQLAFYWLAIHWYFKNELKLNIEEYDYETYIIAIQSHDGYEIKVFKFTPESIEARLEIIDSAVRDIAWHKNNNLWDHSRSYYEGDGIEIYDNR